MSRTPVALTVPGASARPQATTNGGWSEPRNGKSVGTGARAAAAPAASTRTRIPRTSRRTSIMAHRTTAAGGGVGWAEERGHERTPGSRIPHRSPEPEARMRVASSRVGRLAGLLLGLPGALGPGPAAAVVQLEPVLSGLQSPLYVAQPRDGTGRLFLVEQAGRIKLLAPGGTGPTNR